MLKILYAVLLLSLLIVQPLFGQECDSPAQVCFNNPVMSAGTADAFPGPSPACIDSNNSVYFSVTTNDIIGGTLNITIDSFNCVDTLANGDSLFAGLEAALYLTTNPGNICDESSFIELDCSDPSIESINLELIDPSPQFEYFVIVDGAVDVLNTMGAGQCEFNIEATGTSIENEFTAGPDFEVDFGESVILQPSGYGDNLMWTPTTGLVSDPTDPNPLAIPAVTTDYTLTTLIDGCLVSDSMTVTVLPSILPYNAFTPNGETFNDTWEIVLIDRYPRAKVKVFSRWGQTVFRSTGYNTPWDGTFNNNRLPAATYYYVIQLEDSRFTGDENLVTGSVAIVY